MHLIIWGIVTLSATYSQKFKGQILLFSLFSKCKIISNGNIFKCEKIG